MKLSELFMFKFKFEWCSNKIMFVILNLKTSICWFMHIKIHMYSDMNEQHATNCLLFHELQALLCGS